MLCIQEGLVNGLHALGVQMAGALVVWGRAAVRGGGVGGEIGKATQGNCMGRRKDREECVSLVLGLNQ